MSSPPPPNSIAAPPANSPTPTPFPPPPPTPSPPPPSTPSPPPPATPSPPPPATPSPPPPATPSPPTTPSPPDTPSPPTTRSPPPPATPSPPTTPSPPDTPSPPTTRSPPPPATPSPPPPATPSTTPATPSPPPPTPSTPPPSSTSTGLVVGIAVAGVLSLLLLAAIFIYCFIKKRKRRDGDPHRPPPPHEPKVDLPQQQHVVMMPPKLSPSKSNSSAPFTMSSGGSSSNYSGSPSPVLPSGFSKSTFTYEELSLATGGFLEANLLGQGGFGYVHKGVLPNGTLVAIKQLKAGSGQGEREFQAEVAIISRVHHKHLVSLVGYCIAGDQRMLVYEYVPNNTMEFHLHGTGRPTMDWPTRRRIALGSAKGFAYLHEDCRPMIIHRDIKAANILIDFNFEAKVADFGLAKMASDANTHVSTRVMGTFGYLAPEYASSGKLTEKSDVFSYGVVLLELITGRRPLNTNQSFMDDSLVDWARPVLTRAIEEDNYESLADPKLKNEYNQGEMVRMVACAAACVRHSARRRPRMSQIVRALEGEMSLDDLNEGLKPGQSSMYSAYGSSDYGKEQYKEEMKRFRKMALGSQEYDSETTSEYGVNPSISSSEARTSREMEVKRNSQGFSGASST